MYRKNPTWRRLVLLISTLLISTQASAVLHIDAIHTKPLDNIDVRDSVAAIAPSATQIAIANSMGATAARWNRFGTPQTIIRHGGFLATGLDANPVAAARDFLSTNAALFNLSVADVAAWEVYHVGDFAHSDAHAVKFRQNFSGLPSQSGGLVTVGVIDGKVSIVTSSIVSIPASTTLPNASLTAADALLIAAQDAGFIVSAGDFSAPEADHAWTKFNVVGLAGTQRVRSMVFPTSTGVHTALETWVVSSDAGDVNAYMYMIDATNGAILSRSNQVFQYDGENSKNSPKATIKPVATRAPEPFLFQGVYTGATCGPSATTFHGPYASEIADGYLTADVVAAAVVPIDDIVIDVYIDRRLGAGIEFLAQFDLLFSPENGTISPVETGVDYYVQVCAYDGQDPLFVGSYIGTWAFNDASAGTAPDPRWRHFTANPLIDLSNTDIRELGCWLDDTCDQTLFNTASRAPWDYDHEAGAATNTTVGNGAVTAEAWLSPLTPAEQYRPIAADRNYDYPWTNVWYTSGCAPSNYATPGVGNDIDAAIVNMFVAHNRVHDWAYYLGFNEVNSNYQQTNFGNTEADRENDPIFGNVQAGAAVGAFPAYLGRDNANWVPLPDGAPGITNQYLWQALLGAFYVPCTDGNYDVGIVGHEVGHGIQHRMTGGPDTGLGGDQGGKMGEGWGDLTGMEMLNEFGFVPVAGESEFAIGTYVLSSPELGIRNYNMSASPLNYSDIQYDPFGNGSPHADGEIWTATNFRIRELFIAQHDAVNPASNASEQLHCATFNEAPQNCPGNRRWVQLMHDGFLLQPASPSMLDARDAQMAADTMRFAEDTDFGDHTDALWLAYARSGMGINASSPLGSNDDNPNADFSLPLTHSLANANVDFVAKTVEGGAFIEAEIFVGDFEARANPVATTDSGGAPAAALIAPGTYTMLARANGHGHFRFELTLTDGQTGTITVNMPTNHASSTNGATAAGVGAGHVDLLDDTEETSWVYNGQVGLLTGPNPNGVPGTFPVADPKIVTVTLPQLTTVNRVQVSALAENGGNRFQNLRQFEIWGCDAGIIGTCVTYDLLYQSDLDAFPGKPIRPLAPNLIIRSFDLPATANVTHLQLRALHNQCTGSTEFTRNDWAAAAVFPDDVQDCRSEQIEDTPEGPLVSRDDVVTAAEFQVFGSVGSVDVPSTICVDDADCDGVLDINDNCPATANAGQIDQDIDGVGDVCDNCLLVSNPDQCNTNAPGDIFGNVCDADLDNNGIVNSFDLTIMRDNFGASGVNDSDLNCNGIVNSFDLTIMRDSFGGNPGPSGLTP